MGLTVNIGCIARLMYSHDVISRWKDKKGDVAILEDVGWLNEVREVRHPIDLTHPLFVRWNHVRKGVPHQPSVPFPERHPYCELCYNIEGRIIQYIGAEKVERTANDLMLMGPGTPHYATHVSYPQRSVTIHFLPILLFEMGPEGDGARVLARFTTPQKIADRVVTPPLRMGKELVRRSQQMTTELTDRPVGSEFRLRALLMETLVDLMRWEESSGLISTRKLEDIDWLQVERALRYMHKHYAEPLYVDQIAQAVGLSLSRLQAMFKGAMGMSCVHYLRTLRISHAKALLCAPEARVTEIALESGFETMSHFNSSFRALLGMSPSEFMRIHQKK